MFKKLLSVVVGLVFLSLAVAQSPELNPDHPDSYTVLKGDTLWDISEKFLTTPWLWPEIWHANPDIDNPHLIYPGDVINLIYINGEPRLTSARVSGDHQTVKLSPRIRIEPLSQAITTIRLDEIEPFLVRARILTKEELDDLPYVVAVEENRITSEKLRKIYVRGLEGEVGAQYAVVRTGHIYREAASSGEISAEEWKLPRVETTIGSYMVNFWDLIAPPYRKAEILGYEVIEIAQATLVQSAEASSLVVDANLIEIMEGDLILPVNTDLFDLTFLPRAPEVVPENTKIIALSNALYGVGKHQVVVINKGIRDGLESGHVLASYRPGQVIRDTVRYPKMGSWRTQYNPGKAELELPDEKTGLVMVFRTFDRLSYALVLNSIRPVKLLDKLLEP